MQCKTIIDRDGDIITTHTPGCPCPKPPRHPVPPTVQNRGGQGDVIITTQPFSIGKVVHIGRRSW